LASTPQVGSVPSAVSGASACWYDGSVQGYDGLNQSITTAIGTTYDVRFSLNDNGGLTTFQHLSTNGDTGNGIDLKRLAAVAGRRPATAAPRACS
jgi:hypothetical protein